MYVLVYDGICICGVSNGIVWHPRFLRMVYMVYSNSSSVVWVVCVCHGMLYCVLVSGVGHSCIWLVICMNSNSNTSSSVVWVVW